MKVDCFSGVVICEDELGGETYRVEESVSSHNDPSPRALACLWTFKVVPK